MVIHKNCVRIYRQNTVNGVESLRDELEMISKSKEELEKRLQTSLVEKDTLCASLDESFEKIHILQRQLREQDMKLQVRYNWNLNPKHLKYRNNNQY